MTFPILTTPRLLLRAFTPKDIPDLVRLAGDWEIARTTTIPHPYSEEAACRWIASQREAFAQDHAVTWAMTHRQEGYFMGAIDLRFQKQRHVAEIGYWVGVPYWGQGYTTEAARAVLAYGFGEQELYRIQARYLHNNPASGRVMQKIGMTYEGTLRAAVFRDGAYYDLLVYAILKPEYERRRAAGEERSA